MNGTLNKVMLIGRLGDDVKMHYFDDNGCIGRFPIATNDSYTNKQTGERITNTDWHSIVVRNKAAELCEKYLKKGDRVYVEGRLKNRQWKGEDGITRYSTEIQVSDFTFLTPKNESEIHHKSNSTESVTTESNQKSPTSDTVLTKATIDENPDDLPF